MCTSTEGTRFLFTVTYSESLYTSRYSAHPCRFGVRIVLLSPPACRKRRLKGGVRGSLMPRSEALTRPEQKIGSSFLLHAHRCPPLGPQHREPEPVPSLETHLKSE